MPQGANRLPNLNVLSQKALHLSAITQRGASDTDAALGGIFAPLRSAPGSQQGKDSSLAVWLIQSSRWGHTNTHRRFPLPESLAVYFIPQIVLFGCVVFSREF